LTAPFGAGTCSAVTGALNPDAIAPIAWVSAQPLNDAGSCPGNDTHRPGDHDQQRKNAYGGDNCLNHFVLLTAVGENHTIA